MGMIKLVNYIRAEISAGKGLPDCTNKSVFEDDRFLRPVLEDDPLLYNLHDIIGEQLDKTANGTPGDMGEAMSQNPGQGPDRITKLEEELRHAQLEIAARKQELETLKHHFGGLGSSEPSLDGSQNGALDIHNERMGNTIAYGNTDSSYFASYSGHGNSHKIEERAQG